MNNGTFDLILALTNSQIVSKISAVDGCSITSAISKFYKSKTYKKLADPYTDVWHLSPDTLFNIYIDETKGINPF